MFEECLKLTSLDLKNFKTQKVKNMSHMFKNCHELSSLDLTSFDISEVENMSEMFSSCGSLYQLELPYMFNQVNSIDKISFNYPKNNIER